MAMPSCGEFGNKRARSGHGVPETFRTSSRDVPAPGSGKIPEIDGLNSVLARTTPGVTRAWLGRLAIRGALLSFLSGTWSGDVSDAVSCSIGRINGSLGPTCAPYGGVIEASMNAS